MCGTTDHHARPDRHRSRRRRLGVLAIVAVAAGGSMEALPAQDAGSGSAQPALTIFDAARHAIASHPAVGAAGAVGAQARASMRTTAAARWPSLELSGSAIRYQEPMLVTPLHGLTAGETLPFDRTLLQASLGAGYVLFDGGVRGARIRQAGERTGIAEAQIDDVTQSMLARVTAAYLDVLARRGIAQAHDRRVAALESERERVRQRYAVGRAAQVEQLRVEAALASAQADRVVADEAFIRAERELARLVGADPATAPAFAVRQVVLADSMVPAREELVRSAIAAGPSIEAARRRLAAADAGVAIASGARWPRLQVLAGYVQRGSANTESWGEWSAGTMVSVPLFTGGATTADIARARAARREAEERLRLAELDVSATVDRALSAVAEAHARVASLTTAVDRFTEVARTEKLALDVGSGTQTDYLDAEADLLVARAGLVEARAGEIVARAELARTTGQLSLAWMEHVLEVAP